MIIPLNHSPIVVGDEAHDLAHLDAFDTVISRKGKIENSDLRIEVVFSCHVFTERAKHGEAHHTVDHYGKKRKFAAERYAMSRKLPEWITKHVTTNALTFISRSYGGSENLILLENENGQTWMIVFCFQPINQQDTDRNVVRMEILSAYAKTVEQEGVSRKKISFFARKCIFNELRVP